MILDPTTALEKLGQQLVNNNIITRCFIYTESSKTPYLHCGCFKVYYIPKKDKFRITNPIILIQTDSPYNILARLYDGA